MGKNFKPDYNNLVSCAYNRKPGRIPLYEHNISETFMESVSGRSFVHLLETDLDGYYAEYCGFQKDLGYDCVTFEGCITDILPFGGALSHPRPGHIDDFDKFSAYPWQDVKGLYVQKFKRHFDALRRQMPEGMKAVGGVGNGVFEIVQDLCGFEGLCILKYDDPDLYAQLFKQVGSLMHGIWEWFLSEYFDLYAVVRFGDDLGYKSNTMLPPEDIKEHIIPQYKRIISLVHSRNKPFLLHSCGNIFSVMDELIDEAKIDAKHSNEDQIADMSVWVERYGERIGNFGGIDTDNLVRMNDKELTARVEYIYNLALKKGGGFAIGSGNSIPPYVNPDKYLLMVNTIRRLRGDF